MCADVPSLKRCRVLAEWQSQKLTLMMFANAIRLVDEWLVEAGRSSKGSA
jgi:hypothetical protein